MSKKRTNRPAWQRKIVKGSPKWQQTLLYFAMDGGVGVYGSLILPVATYLLGWMIVTAIITPICVWPLIFHYMEKEAYRDRGHGLDHKEGKGIFILIIAPLSLIFWITCLIFWEG